MREQYSYTITNGVELSGRTYDQKGSDTKGVRPFAESILSHFDKSDFVETLDEIGTQDRLGRRAQGDSPPFSLGHLGQIAAAAGRVRLN